MVERVIMHLSHTSAARWQEHHLQWMDTSMLAIKSTQVVPPTSRGERWASLWELPSQMQSVCNCPVGHCVLSTQVYSNTSFSFLFLSYLFIVFSGVSMVISR
ncbi:uncharacterized protein [Physcomitrium patens]|uniref:Uncharacterized protein n=2 Tax=Physcomitrium patens TaxID=3218 RepID=A0A2K1IDT3_PHYPA|nr:hypothetical protein PHYPA_029586 [Physcomitrium patens]